MISIPSPAGQSNKVRKYMINAYSAAPLCIKNVALRCTRPMAYQQNQLTRTARPVLQHQGYLQKMMKKRQQNMSLHFLLLSGIIPYLLRSSPATAGVQQPVFTCCFDASATGAAAGGSDVAGLLALPPILTRNDVTSQTIIYTKIGLTCQSPRQRFARLLKGHSFRSVSGGAASSSL